MRKIISSSSYALLVIILLTSSLSFLIINSCRKIRTESIEKSERLLTDEFFRIPDNSPSALIQIANTIKKQNEVKKFVGRFSREVGKPNWSGAVVVTPNGGISASEGGTVVNATNQINGGGGTFGTDTLAFVPLIKEGETWVSSFLACWWATRIKLK